MKIFRNPEIPWREENLSKERALAGLETGADVSGVGTSIILAGGNMHSLNILGTEVWKLCDGRTFEELVASLQDAFDVEPSVLRRDVLAFIRELKGLGLIHER